MYAIEYQRAKSVADATAALAKTGGKALAGGQSLVGAMKLRLANPGTVVDLSGIAELKGIKKEGDAVVIGALTTHAEVASSSTVKQAIPALAALAEGDIELVQRAIRASSEGQKPAEVEKVARYILTEMARRKAEARRSVANVA